MAADIDQTDVAERVYCAVEALAKSSPLPLRCEYEHLPTDRAELPCVSMQTLSGQPVEKRYIDGSAIMQYPFSLVLRQAADDERERLDATAVLRELSQAMRSLGERGAGASLDLGPGAVLWGIAATSLPARIQAQPGCCDYQVTMAVKYRTDRIR